MEILNFLSSLKNAIDFVNSNKAKINWKLISSNTFNEAWGFQFIELYADYLNWTMLCKNKSLIWTSEKIDLFKHRIDWKVFSANENISWNLALIQALEQHIDWNVFSANKGVKWQFPLIRHFEHKLRFDLLQEAITLFDEELLDTYKHKWVWGGKWVDWHGEEYRLGGLSYNPRLPWSINLINKYAAYWDWRSLGMNSAIVFNDEILIQHKDKWKYDRTVAVDKNEGIGFEQPDSIFDNKNITWPLHLSDFLNTKRKGLPKRPSYDESEESKLISEAYNALYDLRNKYEQTSKTDDYPDLI